MDIADKAKREELLYKPQHMDILKGYDIEREYGSIMNGTSKLSDRIQGLVIDRYNGIS